MANPRRQKLHIVYTHTNKPSGFTPAYYYISEEAAKRKYDKLVSKFGGPIVQGFARYGDYEGVDVKIVLRTEYTSDLLEA